MGGGKVKRRKYLEVWAWRNMGSDTVTVSPNKKRPQRVRDCTDTWRWSYTSTMVCVRWFKLLTGIDVPKTMDPIKVRIPPWTVLKGKP